MKLIVSLAGLAVVGFATPFSEHEHEFIRFIAKYNKKYATREEYERRLGLFQQNKQFVAEHASDSFQVEINEYADIDRTEFFALTGGIRTDKADFDWALPDDDF